MPATVSKCDLIMPALVTGALGYKTKVLLNSYQCTAVGRLLNARAALSIKDVVHSYVNTTNRVDGVKNCCEWLNDNELFMLQHFGSDKVKSGLSYIKGVRFMCDIGHSDVERYDDIPFFEIGWSAEIMTKSMPNGIINVMRNGCKRNRRNFRYDDGYYENNSVLKTELRKVGIEVSDRRVPNGDFNTELCFITKTNQNDIAYEKQYSLQAGNPDDYSEVDSDDGASIVAESSTDEHSSYDSSSESSDSSDEESCSCGRC